MRWRETHIHQRLSKILLHVELSQGIQTNLDILCNALTETRENLHEVHSDNDIKALIDKVYEKPDTDMGDF